MNNPTLHITTYGKLTYLECVPHSVEDPTIQQLQEMKEFLITTFKEDLQEFCPFAKLHSTEAVFISQKYNHKIALGIQIIGHHDLKNKHLPEHIEYCGAL